MTPDPVAKPRKEDHTVRLSSYFTDLARQLADAQDAPFAEILNKACERGLDEMAEKYLKRLTLEKVKRRLSGEPLPDDKED